jgi:glyceraldehyde 3-phosphate dehydrogenase
MVETKSGKGVGINGIAGRIGKFAAYELEKLGGTIVAVNDLATTDSILDSLSRRDGVHGVLDWKVKKIGDQAISINEKPVRVYHERDPANIQWGEGVNAIDECTGLFTERSAAEKHFAKSPNLETIIVSAPGKGMNTYVMGVDHMEYKKDEKVISNASCTTKALAVPIQILLDSGLEIYAILMDTTHAATNTQKPLDFMAEYGTLGNIISSKTGAAIATGEVIPQLKGKMDGFAFRVPVQDGSFANFYFVAEAKDLSVAYLNSVFKSAVSDPRYCGRIEVFDGKEIGTPDILGNTASAIVALSKTKSILIPLPGKNPQNQFALMGIVSGYDNERGPAKDLAMLTQYVLQK